MSSEEDEKIRAQALPYDDPRFIRAKKFMDRLLPSTGLESLPWRLELGIDNGLYCSSSQTASFIIMSKGFVDAAKSDDELAAVIAHEFGRCIVDHEREQYNLSHLGSKLLLPWIPVVIPGALMTAGGAFLMDPLLGAPGAIMLGVPLLPFINYRLAKSCSREYEADYIGLLLMTSAGYDPTAAITIHETIDAWQDQQLKELQDKYPKQKFHKS